MTSSDTNVDNLVINQLTRAQYNQLCSQNKIEPDQLYFITDDKTADEVLDDRLTGYYTKSETDALSTSFRSGLQPAGDYQTKQTTLAGYGITDAKIQNGVITLGSNTITPLTSHQSLAAYATTAYVSTNYQPKGSYLTAHQSLADYAKTSALTAYQPKGDYLTAHQSLANYYTKSQTDALSTAFRSGLQTKQTTLAGYGITDAKIQNGVITLGSNTITPLTSHQSLTNYYTKSQTDALSTSFRSGLATTASLNSYETKADLSTNYYNKTQVNAISSAISGSTDTFVDGVKTNISAVHVSRDDYAQLLRDNAVLSNVIYFVSADTPSNYDRRLENVSDPENATDAANKGYVDAAVAGVDVAGQLTAYAKTSALTAYQPKGSYVSYTSTTQTVAGTSKTVSKTSPSTLYVQNGLVMGGTAQAAGLVTRGICGSSEPTASGGATKSQLYVNYDGNNNNNPAERGLVLNAGSVGANLGNGVYQYTAVRGDALCAYVQSKGYATQASMTVLSGAISSKIHLNVPSQSVNKDLSALVINKLTQAEYDALAVKNSEQLYIVESDGSSGRLNANSQTVVNVAAPVNATDAANKDYVDNRSIVIFGGNASTCG